MWTFVHNAFSSQYRKTVTVGLIVATAGSFLTLSPWGMRVEKDVGLHLLYQIRGPVQPPPDVVIVNMSKRSIDRMGLRSNYRDWPRALHAKLVDRLVELGAAVIVFDVFFKQKRDRASDTDLGRAIARSQRSVLIQYLGRDTVIADRNNPSDKIVAEIMISPVEVVAHSAAGLGPFPLPKVPARIDQFWAFKKGAGGVPTLPLVALQVWALQSSNFEKWIWQNSDPALRVSVSTFLDSQRGHVELTQLMRSLRGNMLQDLQINAETQKLGEKISGADVADQNETRLLKALIRAYHGPNSYFINYYGPPSTIATIPYHRLVANGPARGASTNVNLKGKVVFVGVSEFTAVNRKEGFYTVFSRQDGIDISGVEIAATAFANLLSGDTLKQLDGRASLAVIFAFGTIVAAIAVLLSGIQGAIVSIGFGAICFAAAQYGFSKHNLWLPIAVPLLVQLPLAVSLGLLAHYVFAKRLSENLAHGIRDYVPEPIAQEIALGKEPEVFTERVDGVCLFIDLEGYTTLSESMPLQALADLTTWYYRVVDRSIEDHGGHVLRRAGDGIMCAWTLDEFRSETDMRRNACLAAIEVGIEIDQYNRRKPGQPLSARIGLDAGEFNMGNMGAGGRYEQSVVGDVINTASRIENLNKQLETRILASEPVTADLEDVLFRRLGTFQLVGKSDGMSIFEIIGRNRSATIEQIDLCRKFEMLLTAYEAGCWADATARSDDVLRVRSDDGPAKFYRDLCAENQKTPPPAGAGAMVILEQK